MTLEKKLPLPIALAWILGSIFLCTGSVYMFMKVDRKEEFFITKLVQTGPHRDALPSYLLQEILELSKDRPTTFHDFNIKIAEEKLQKLPMIKEAHVFLFKPNTIYIDYTIREPIAMLCDYENIAVDEEGFLFLFYPFYSPKELPQIYLGKTLTEEASFFKPLNQEGFLLAKEILKMLSQSAIQEKFFIKRIDVSSAFEKSFGRQEIVIDIAHVSLEWEDPSKEGFLHRLRLPVKDYSKQLGNYLVLHKELISPSYARVHDIEERVIDLRLEGLAFIDQTKDD